MYANNPKLLNCFKSELHGLGWQPAWFAEIQPFPCAVLKHHYPQVVNLGDMTQIAEGVQNGAVEAPDVLVGGTPCQAFSVAGSRQSLSDERGNLTLKFVELANAIDVAKEKKQEKPCIIVWENVPGVLSTSDNAFGCFLAALCGESHALQPTGAKWTNAGVVHGPKRHVAWRVLNAQHFGHAQRRRRVFVVASAGDFDPAQVLIECGAVHRYSTPSKDARCSPGGLGGGRSCEAGEVRFIAGNIIGRQPQHGGNQLGVLPGMVSRCLTGTDRHAVILKDGVRFLTPKECERLQGFGDDYTLVPYGNGLASDHARYTALGNSMPVLVMRWIGERIVRIL